MEKPAWRDETVGGEADFLEEHQTLVKAFFGEGFVEVAELCFVLGVEVCPEEVAQIGG